MSRAVEIPLVRLGAVLALVLAAAVGLGLALGPLARSPAFREPAQGRVAEGVYLDIDGERIELGGLRPYEACGLLEDSASRWSVPARDAYIDRRTGGVVPALDGRRLDVAATVAAAVAAAPGQAIKPVFYPVPPLVGLADFPEAPVYSGNRAKNEVAVVLNVAWGDEFLEHILATVEGAGGRLTICPVGQWLDADAGRAAWLAEAAARGHEIGNHGYYNRPMTYSAAKVKDELDRTAALIRQACGRQPAVFAPPMGEFNQTTLAAASAAGYRTVLWSLDTIDWRREGVDVIAGRVTSRVKPGDIILCHPTDQTAAAMREFLPVLAAQGLRLVTVSELLSPELPPGATPTGQPPEPGR